MFQSVLPSVFEPTVVFQPSLFLFYYIIYTSLKDANAYSITLFALLESFVLDVNMASSFELPS